MSLSLEQLGIKNTGAGYQNVGSVQPKVQSVPKVTAKAASLPTPVQKGIATAQNIGGFLGEVNKAYDKTPVIGGIKKAATAGFSGFMKPVGDALGLLSHGVGGFAQGMRTEAEKQAPSVKANKLNAIPAIGKSIISGITNIPNGIRNNVSPSDTVSRSLTKDFGVKNQAVLAGAGLVTDIATDPLNYVNPVSAISKLGKFAKLPELATKIYNESTKAKTVVDAGKKVLSLADKTLVTPFSYGRGVPKPFLNAYENVTGRGVQKSVDIAHDVARPLTEAVNGQKFTPEEQKIIGDVFSVLSGQTNRALTENELKLVSQYKPLFDATAGKFEKLAKQQIKAGVDPKIFDKYLGKYTGKRIYESKLSTPPSLSTFIQPKNMRLNLSQYQKRTDIPQEIRTAMGEVKQPAFGAATAAYNEAQNIEKLKFYKTVAKKYAGKAGDGMVQMPNDQKLGVLKGAYLPSNIADYVNSVSSPVKGDPLIKFFKEGKTILSPKQIARNTAASQVQAFMNPSGRADSIRRIPEAIKELRTQGPYYKEARDAGLIDKTFAQTELGQYLPEGVGKVTSKVLGSEKLGKVKDAVGTGYDWLKKPGSFLQNANENMAKLQVFINERKAGKTVAEAVKTAEETGFNYEKVTPFVNELRKGVPIRESRAFKNTPLAKIPVINSIPFSIPFATYGIKAAELTGKTLVKQPQRLANVIKTEQAINNLSKDKPVDEKNMPDYQKDAVKTPFTDKRGNSYYANTKYIYPWGSLPDAGSLGLPLGQSPDPYTGEGISQFTNKDIFTGKQIQTKPGLWGVGERVRHGAETVLATPVRSALKIADAATKKPRYSTSPTVGEAIAQEAGLPIFKYDPKLGAKFSSYDKATKIREIKSAMLKDLKDYVGNPQEQAKIRKYYLQEMRKAVAN